MEVTKITSKHQATVPAEVRAALGLKAGDAIQWEVAEDGAARVRKAEPMDWAWHHAVSKTLESEWLGPEDEEAWRDL
jgi:AbrB family looped-hinge helix DNA binding protein